MATQPIATAGATADAVLTLAARVSREYVSGCRILGIDSPSQGGARILVGASDGSRFTLECDRFGGNVTQKEA